MFEIGSSLRQARQHRRLELADVERATHIRIRYLGALEDDRFELLPSPAYVRGFLRTYAEFLGLDGGMLVDEYNAHFAPAEEELQPIRPQGLARGSGVARRVAGIVAGLAAATAVVWQLGFASSPPRRVTTSFGTPKAAAATHAPRTKPAAKPHAKRTAAAPARPATLVVHATDGPCWVEVRVGSAAGRTLYRRILQPGGTLRFGLRKRLWVRLGAPWNADVTIRGRRVSGLPHTPVDLNAA